MPFWYDTPVEGSFRQGEIVGPIWEHRPLVPPAELPAGTEVAIRSVRHELGVVMTPDCDLIWDFDKRFIDEAAREAYGPEDDEVEKKAAAVPHILLCEVYDQADIFDHIAESRLRKLVRGNRDERYHYFPESALGAAEAEVSEHLPEIYLDFKKPFAIPTTHMYEGIRSGEVKRIAWIPPIYRHDLVHRFYGFLSRVAIPAD